MCDDLIHKIIHLADHVDPNSEAVREWFFETPVWPYDKTALELVQSDQGDAVIAFLRRILRDIEASSEPMLNRLVRTQHRRHVTVTSTHRT